MEFDRATGSPADHRRSQLYGTADLATTEPVFMEVLAGASNEEQAVKLRALMLDVAWCPVQPATDVDAAQIIYRRCRAAAITPRGLLDCLIAAVAWRTGAAILAHDVDVDRIAGVVGIPMNEGSLRSSGTF